jgi:hypothetical protein
VASRWITPLAVMIILLTASCGQQAGGGGGGSPGGEGTPGAGPTGTIPFGAFLASLGVASYRDYAGRSGTRVQDQQAFDEMRDFLLAKYRHSLVVRSYGEQGAIFDCMDQVRSSALPPTPASPSTGSSSTSIAVTKAVCPNGSVPVRRITLDDLVRFSTLRQYLGKSPGGPGQQLPPIRHTP